MPKPKPWQIWCEGELVRETTSAQAAWTWLSIATGNGQLPYRWQEDARLLLSSGVCSGREVEFIRGLLEQKYPATEKQSKWFRDIANRYARAATGEQKS